MESRKRRIRSLFTNSSDMNSFTEPINKTIKPTQIYDDSPFSSPYKNDSPIKVSTSPQPDKFKPYLNSDISKNCTTCICTCNCHKSPIKVKSESLVSTANSKRSKGLMNSPIKTLGRNIVESRGSDQSQKSNFSIFPYGGDISKRLGTEDARVSKRRNERKISKSFAY